MASKEEKQYRNLQLAAQQAADAVRNLESGTEAHRIATLRSQEATQASIQAELAMRSARNESAAALADTRARLDEATAALEANKRMIELAAKQAEAGQSTFNNLAGSIGLMSTEAAQSNTTLNMFTKNGLKGLAKGVADVLKPMNLLQSIFTLTLESSQRLATALDDTTSSLNMTTGLGDEFKDSIVTLQPQVNKLGVTVQDLGEAFGGLGTSLGTFTNLSQETQTTIGRGAAVLEKFGQSAETTGANIGIMTATMGVSAETALNLQAGLLNMAADNEIATGQMMQDFAATADSLAAFGNESVDVFADLAMAAKQSNMQVSQLLGIAANFDTFDSATESVGRLNALLGGPFLNSLEMVMVTDPTERIRMLSDALNSTGRSFQDMSYYESKAIADAAGLASVGDLAKVMSGNFEGLAGNIGQSAEELERVENMRADFMSLTEKLQTLLMEFAFPFLDPLVQGLKKVVDFVQKLSPETKKAIAMMAAFAVAGKLVKSFMSDTADESERLAGEGAGGGGGISSFMKDMAANIALIGGAIVLAEPAFKILSAFGSKLGDLFSGFGDVGDTLQGIQGVGTSDFAKTAQGIRSINSAIGELDTEKAVAISTVFDSAGMGAVDAINAGSVSAVSQSAAASAGAMSVTAPVQIHSKIVMNDREFGSAVSDANVVLQLADAAIS